MIKTSFFAAAAFALLLLTNTDTVQAQGFMTPYGIGGFGTLGSPYALGRVPEPPYFALHPPVYYSQPVARTYGYSPFAYPGSVRTPDVQAAMPTAKEVKNPYVRPAKTKAEAKPVFNKSLTKTGPQEISNPFVAKRKTKLVSF